MERSARDATGLTELDLALVEALQVDPRGPWTRIGPSIGVDATTAARRWERLTGLGLAWLTVYPTAPTLVLGYLDLGCAADRLGAVTDWLCAHPAVFSVERQTGLFPLTVGVDAWDLPSFDGFVAEEVGRVPGVTAVRSAVAMRQYREGSGWRVRALSAEQAAGLDRTVGHARLRTPPRASDPADAALVRGLAVDGRRTCRDLADECGMTEATVRRRIGRMMAGHEVEFRCDLAGGLAGWPVIANFRLDVPGARLGEVGALIAAQPETRWCAAMTGEHNMRVCVWLRAPEDAVAFEARLSALDPAARVAERTLTTWMPKRMGRLLDADGVAKGVVPMAPLGG